MPNKYFLRSELSTEIWGARAPKADTSILQIKVGLKSSPEIKEPNRQPTASQLPGGRVREKKSCHSISPSPIWGLIFFLFFFFLIFFF